MKYNSLTVLLISFILPISNINAYEAQECNPKFTIETEEQLEDGVKNYLACLKLVSSQLDQLAKNLENAPPLQLATHSVNSAKFYNIYAKAMRMYGKFQLDYITYFMNHLHEDERISKSSFLLNFLETNKLVQDLEKISLSENHQSLLVPSGKSITEYIKTK